MENRERIVILGAGESGTGAAILARRKDMMYLFQMPGRSNLSTGICWTSTRYCMNREDTRSD